MEHELENMPLNEFCDYIETNHHAYIRKTLRLIEPLLVNLAKDEGEKNPVLNQVLKNFSSMADGLAVHIQKEESVLFPYIRKLVLSSSIGGPKPESHFSSVSTPVQKMEADHGAALKAMREIRRITRDYSGVDVSLLLSDAYKRLEEFETDLLKHIEIENKILFPKAINLEAEMYDNR